MAAPVVTISGHPLVSPFLVKCYHPCVISADVTGRPDPSVTWYIDCGEKVVEGPQFHIERHDGGKTHSLTISNIDENFNKRLLTIYAVNVHGYDTSMMDLKTFKGQTESYDSFASISFGMTISDAHRTGLLN